MYLWIALATVALLWATSINSLAYEAKSKILLPVSICASEHGIYIADDGDKTLKHININGEVLNMFGGEGEGPGEFMQISNIHCGVNGIYALDAIQMRVTFLSYKSWEDYNVFKLNDVLSFQHEIIEWGDKILIAGSSKRNKKVIHLYDKGFVYLKSLGPDLEFENANPFIEYAREQLSHTEVAVLNDSTIIYVRPAPMELSVIRVNENYDEELLTQTRHHNIVRRPWETDYIKINADSYNVGLYPRAHSVSSIFNEDLLYVVVYEETESKKGHVIYMYDIKNDVFEAISNFDTGIVSAVYKENDTKSIYIMNPYSHEIRKVQV